MEYENIFNRAKAAYGTGAYDDATLEFIFPELAESEDERIRKVLIHIVKSACSKYGIKYIGDKITEEMLLAYLEKQKEQKPADGKELLYVSNKSYNIGYRDGKREAEQKTAEWSEEDETCLECALWCVMKTRHFVAKDTCDLDACRCAERWLKSLRPTHWKPTEEQMKALKKVAYSLIGTGTETDIYLVQLYEQLKAIKEEKK